MLRSVLLAAETSKSKRHQVEYSMHVSYRTELCTHMKYEALWSPLSKDNLKTTGSGGQGHRVYHSNSGTKPSSGKWWCAFRKPNASYQTQVT